MTEIHSSAIVSPEAQLGDGISIGPYCIVGPRVKLGERVRLHSHVVVEGVTEIGAETQIFPFASIGHRPQDLKYSGEETTLVIGERNVIREGVTMNPGTVRGTRLTRIGSDCLFMLGSHVAHDCVIGNHVILSNNIALAGHCIIDDHAIVAGLAGIHQFVRVGTSAFIGGLAGVVDDVIPFGMVVGNRGKLRGLNVVGLKRRGFSHKQILELRKAYQLLFSSEGHFADRVAEVEAMYADNDAVKQIIDFIRAPAKRPICQPARTADRGSDD